MKLLTIAVVFFSLFLRAEGADVEDEEDTESEKEFVVDEDGAHGDSGDDDIADEGNVGEK